MNHYELAVKRLEQWIGQEPERGMYFANLSKGLTVPEYTNKYAAVPDIIKNIVQDILLQKAETVVRMING